MIKVVLQLYYLIGTVLKGVVLIFMLKSVEKRTFFAENSKFRTNCFRPNRDNDNSF